MIDTQRLIADVTAVLKRNQLDQFKVTAIVNGVDVQLGKKWNYLDSEDLKALLLIAESHGTLNVKVWVDGSKGIEITK